MKRLIVLLLLITLLSACSEKEKNVENEFPLHMEVGNFKGLNQDGEAVSFSKLKGKVWVADFMFTNCDTVCSPMTANMAELQRKLADEGVEVQLVSFSIDPDNDQPGVLKDYASGVEADFSNWDLVTGYKQEFIESFANKSFMAAAAKMEGSNQFVHSTSFYLVDEKGIVVQKYEGVSEPPYEQIVKDIKLLQ
ncbi:protein SCO1/2 [Bacillus sp. SORGH_AS 510]|uniref:SCO family protein n=1 Tax=Bacillus sp. SORGH_AS_0510 TaxID=3041771 RepID=UPI0027828572|nr:SCO family protein [Bacillus sp. SORGH_AS_0510]MDQ1145977.1 protein SCO1/2 [Bacillus sp. SORGH_AS_0510]